MRTRLTAAAIAAAALLTLTACSSSSSNDSKPASAPTTDSAATIDTGIPPAPTGTKRAAYLAAIKAVDPALVADPDKAIDAGRNQCSTLNGGGANADHSAAERFGNDTHPLTDAQGKAINAALLLTLCPKS